ncbi:MAG: DUF4364 family protein [Clostridiales bacterium]|nr:DUF4364 family protein [Clostridiales bacterium]
MAKKITTLHDKNNLTENKFIILYITRKLGVKLNSDQIFVLADKYSWMNYFDMRECIIDLCDAGFLNEENETYTITSEGFSLIENFMTSIAFSIRTIIDDYAKDNKSKILIDQQIIADYCQDSAHEYPVTLKIIENEVELFSSRIVAANEEDAKRLVDRFKQKSSKIYASLIKELTSDS